MLLGASGTDFGNPGAPLKEDLTSILNKQFHPIPFHSMHTVPLHAASFHSIPLHSVPFHSVPFHSIPFDSMHTIPTHSISNPFYSRPLHSIAFRSIACRCIPCPFVLHSTATSLHDVPGFRISGISESDAYKIFEFHSKLQSAIHCPMHNST